MSKLKVYNGSMNLEHPIERKKDSVKMPGQVDTLLARLPMELQEVWEDRIDSLSESEQVEMLAQVLKKRSQSVDPTQETHELLPEGVEIFERFPDEVKELLGRLKDSSQKIEIGYGKAAHVVAAKGQEGVCYKVLLPHEQQPPGTNDIARETELQQKAYAELDGTADVRVPAIFGFIHESGTRAMIMELLNAVSVRQVVEEKVADLPAVFNIDQFIVALQNFVNTMHEKRIYHRDLHGGNILIDRETGLPCVIDFGLSTDSVVDERDAYTTRVVNNGQMENHVLLSDTDAVQQIKNQIQHHMSNGGV